MMITAIRVLGDSGKTYTVSANASDERVTCTCPDFEHRASLEGRDCKHIAFVKALMGAPAPV